MKLVTIESRSNEKVKAYCKLRDAAKERREKARFVLEGLRLCADCAESGFGVETVFITDTALQKGGARVQALLDVCAAAFLVTQAVAEKMANTVSTQGVFCIAQMPARQGFTPVAGGRYLALECIQNPLNLGATARTAEALGVTGLLVAAGCDIYNPKALRASMGSLLRLPVAETENLAETLCALQGVLPTFAAVPDSSAIGVREMDTSNGAVLVVGNEGNGVSEAVLQAAQQRVTIPMQGAAESLNAAAAATILMWEMMQ